MGVARALEMEKSWGKMLKWMSKGLWRDTWSEQEVKEVQCEDIKFQVVPRDS